VTERILNVVADVKLAARVLIKDRWITLAAATIVALGISVNTAVFTLSDAVLFRSVPFEEPDRTVLIWMSDAGQRELGVSFPDLLDWRRSMRSLSGLSMMFLVPRNVSEDDKAPESYAGAAVSSSLFQILDAKPLIGRTLTAEDDRDNGPTVVVLSYGMWQRRYGGDPSVLGRTIRVNDLPVTIVGVMQPGMQFPPNTDFWLPGERMPFARMLGRQSRVFQVLGKLADGATIPQAQSELDGIVSQLAKDYPRTNQGVAAHVGPYGDRVIGPRIKLVFVVLMGAVASVLLIACANVANLQLSRSARRTREVGIRLALGASRWSIVRQLLVESVMLALLGGLLSLPLSFLGITWFDGATQHVGKPYWMTFGLDLRAFAFFLGVCVLTGIAFGLAPAWLVSKTNLNDVLKEGGRASSGSSRVRRWSSSLLIAEVAFMVVLLASAGFMIRSFLAIYRLDLGIDTSRLLVMQMTLTDRKYPTQGAKRQFTQRLDDRLAANTMLEGVTTASYWPLGGGLEFQLEVEGRPKMVDRPLPVVTVVSVGRRYFETLGVRLSRGRAFIDDDNIPSQAGVIVNERFAAVHFGQEDPIGQSIRLSGDDTAGVRLPKLTIVGVVGNLRQRISASLDYEPIAYVHDMAIPTLGRPTALIVRTRSEELGQVPQLLRDEVRAIDADVPVVNIQTLEQNVALQAWSYRVFGLMFTGFAFIALVLAAVGVYAVTAYSVAQRTQEIGLRMALGAAPSEVILMFLRQTTARVAVGLAIGMAGALGVGQILHGLLVGTSARDGATLASIVAVTVAVSFAACILPAAHAARLDPVAALRRE
jgi:putative ABC transport system permease protein